ncbi:hypothetical protein KN815_16135 [Streptomyces sp. 4503]|uniref:Uncharacterized protein n=1 Tax=Streptomyces niphimycinicus TaxID=2842201 RepID=A0ABS6CF73_9ACTN|nr:hypothetical protein [Streptomyces niphimycinicus]MBU3865551.1 hypothetical protein [Streptomyces niphimycinicus]
MSNTYDWRDSSDSDLSQGMEMATEAAREARQTGDKQREAAFHNDLNTMIDRAEERGWFGRRRS